VSRVDQPVPGTPGLLWPSPKAWPLPPKRLKLTLITDLDPGGPWENLWAGHLFTGDTEPVRGEVWHQVYGKKNCWIYKGKLFQIEGAETVPQEELKLRIKHEVVRRSRELPQIRREVEAFDNLDKFPSAVRRFVWQRDAGQCVKCGSKERLEFDHIIPVVKGGATTAWNIQLLCESCNRKKGPEI